MNKLNINNIMLPINIFKSRRLLFCKLDCTII